MDFSIMTRFFRFMPQEALNLLISELRARGHRLLIVRPFEVRLKETAGGHSQLIFFGQQWQKSDLLIPLLRSEDDYGWLLIEEISKMGQTTLRTPRLPQDNREAMTALFQQNGLIMPATFLRTRAEVWRDRKILPWPLQIQARLEQNGRLVTTVGNWTEFDAAISEYEQVLERDIFLRESRDLKRAVYSVVVIGDKVMTNVEHPYGLQEVKPGRKSSIVGHAYLKPGKISPAMEKAAVIVRRIYGVTHAAVDMVHTPKGPLILDVNVAPNLAWYERMTGVSLINKVVDFWEQVAKAAKHG